jgi:NitT/TauT family transport system ATP-binding protein
MSRDAGGDPGPAAVTCRAVARRFGPVAALAGVDLDVPAGSALGLVGPSGCGKSTLLRIIAGLLEPSSGTVAVGGRHDAAGRLAACALMPQRDLLLPWRSAVDNAGVPLENAGRPRHEARRRAAALLERFGLADAGARRPAELSGGMRQRVAFARTLLAGKPVLLLDEPFGSLDAITRADLQEWLRGALEGLAATTILVTHDIEEALLLCRRVAVMRATPGRIARVLDVDLPDAARADLVASPELAALRREATEALA